MTGKCVFTMDFDHPLRKGNQVTQVVNSSMLGMKLQKLKSNKLRNVQSKVDVQSKERINGWIEK